MRNKQRWLLLLLRHHSLSPPQISQHFINQPSFSVNRSVTSSTINSSHMLFNQPSTFCNFSISDVMRGKGYEVSRGTFNWVIERFKKEEMSGDVKKLKDLYGSSELVENSSENVCSRVCKLIYGNKWGDNGETIVGVLGAAMVVSGGGGGRGRDFNF
ncbi:hypothetical protein BC332_03773 [Capsicum chinense]|nr:hypothetical protein BC332_03773 [Capsicum chinense]